MSYHSHKLNSNHTHIIGRTDPITGDVVKVNDKVVFCAVCKSCFLEESWVFMDERHCEQSETLEDIPQVESNLVAKKIEEEIIFKKNKKVNVLKIVFLTMILSFYPFELLLLMSGLFSNEISVILASFFGSILFGLGLGHIISTSFFREITGLERKLITISHTELKIGKEKYLLKNIRQIKFQRQMEYIGERPVSKIPTLFIYFQDGKRIIENFPTKDYQSAEAFLEGLAKISKFVEVYFYSEQSQEHIVIKCIRDKTKGNIIVGEPHILLADRNYPNQF